MPQADSVSTTLAAVTVGPLSPAPWYLPIIHSAKAGAFFSDLSLDQALSKAELVQDIADGQHENVDRVIGINVEAGASWDASREIAQAVLDTLPYNEPIPAYVFDFLEDHLGCQVMARVERERMAA
jgi:hypothetical protein